MNLMTYNTSLRAFCIYVKYTTPVMLFLLLKVAVRSNSKRKC